MIARRGCGLGLRPLVTLPQKLLHGRTKPAADTECSYPLSQETSFRGAWRRAEWDLGSMRIEGTLCQPGREFPYTDICWIPVHTRNQPTCPVECAECAIEFPFSPPTCSSAT